MIGGRDGRGDWGACNPREARNRRTRASVLVEQAGKRLLIDTSPDMREQLMAQAVPRVDAIVWTHAHADHVMGLDDIRILNRIANASMPVFANAETFSELQRRFDYAFTPWTGPGYFRPVLAPVEVAPGETVAMAGMDVRLIDQDHGFSRTLGIRIGGFAYSTDFVRLDDDAIAALAGLDTWVVDCFQRAEHRTHCWFERTLEMIAAVKPRRAVISHMGPDLDWDWLVRKLPAGAEPAYDGMRLEIAG